MTWTLDASTGPPLSFVAKQILPQREGERKKERAREEEREEEMMKREREGRVGGEKREKRERKERDRSRELRESTRVSGRGRERRRRGEDGGIEVAQGEEEEDLTQIGSLTAAAAAAE